jgi:hypothetical protein
MKDYYLWFLIVFILAAGCVVSYKYGYGDGYKLGSSMCPAVWHPDPHDQNASDRPDGVMYPQQDTQAK